MKADFALSPHIGLASGEILNKELDSIQARGTARASWLLEVKGKVDSPVIERIKVLYRPSGDTSWLNCEYDILLNGKERLLRLACSVEGHDSVWADPGYEEIIPKPVQVSYTITNTGNVRLGGCTAAIVLEDPFELYPGIDSVQQYGSINPGKSETRSWLLTVAEDRMAPGERTVRWERSCPEAGTEPRCEHRIKLLLGSPSGLVLTPRRLRFEAERNGALPASQQLELRPGGGLVMPWTLQPSTSWLDALPLSGDRRAMIDVRPNTTAMPEGLYLAAIDLQSAYPASPPRVDVEYEITKTTGIAPEARPSGLHLEQNYPNPVRTISVIRYHLPTTSYATLALYDIYGRRIATLAEGTHTAGRHTATLDASTLATGVYVCALSAGGKTAMRAVAVRR
jgi:hypothetical protein